MERSRLESFLHSAEVLKVHGLCDQVNEKSEQTKAEITNNPAKKLKKVTKPVTTTISPAFPLRPSSRNSPKAGPSAPPPPTKSPVVAAPMAAVKVEEPNLSDEENHPEHLVIPSDPNSIRVTKQEALFDENYGNCARPNEDEDSIAADSSSDTGKTEFFAILEIGDWNIGFGLWYFRCRSKIFNGLKWRPVLSIVPSSTF